MRAPSRLLLAVPLLLAACDGSAGEYPDASLPETFWIVGEAHAVDADGRTATCVFEFLLTLTEETRRTGEQVAYSGSHGGHAGRTVLDRDGSGLSIFADVGGAAGARLVFPDRLEIAIPANADAEGRFWRAFALLSGTVADADTSFASGAWTCAPLDLDQGGYVDTSFTVEGRWRMEGVPVVH
jgi:hypothetical protein